MDKMYYFEIPDPIEPEQENQMKDILINNIGVNDDELIFFTDAKKGMNTFYTLWPSHVVEKIIKNFKKLGILFSYKDVTEEVLIGTRKNNPGFYKLFSSGNNKVLIEKFIRANTTVDFVLDKINKSGLKSLTIIDKEVLNKK